MRRLIAALSPAVLEQLGLRRGAAPTGEAAFSACTSSAGSSCKSGAHGPMLPQQTEVITYRLVQECFNNIGKHSRKPLKVNISLASADGHPEG